MNGKKRNSVYKNSENPYYGSSSSMQIVYNMFFLANFIRILAGDQCASRHACK